MQQVKKVVLAYSGGVDTSVCIPYLKNEYGISEVVAFVADLGPVSYTHLRAHETAYHLV